MTEQKEKTVNIALCTESKFTLILTLGYAAGAYMQKEGFVPKSLQDLTDEVLMQTGGKPYWHPRPEVIEDL